MIGKMEYWNAGHIGHPVGRFSRLVNGFLNSDCFFIIFQIFCFIKIETEKQINGLNGPRANGKTGITGKRANSSNSINPV